MPVEPGQRFHRVLRSSSLLRDLLIAGVAIYLGSSYLYRYLFYPTSSLAPMIALAFGGVMILWRPVYGTALLLLTYPFVPPSGGIGIVKVGVALLLGYNLALWLWTNARRGRHPWALPEYRWIFVFTIYLGVSPLLGMKYGFTLSDWLRDIAPLLMLLMIPVLVDHFGEKGSRWLIYLVVVPVAAGLLRDIVFILNRHLGLGMGWVAGVPVRLSTLHPPLMFMAGLALFASRAPRRNRWLLLALLALLAAGLTQTRTVWLAMALAVPMVLFFFTRYRAQAVVLMVLLVIGTLIALYNTKATEQVLSQQEERFRSLVDYQHDISFQNRSAEFAQAGRLFLEAPLLGVGYGFQYRFYRFIAGIGMGHLRTNFTHNDLINVAAKGGLAGLFLMAMVFRGLLLRLRIRAATNAEHATGAWAVVAMIACYLGLFVGLSTPVLQTREAVFILAVVIALGLGYGGEGGGGGHG